MIHEVAFENSSNNMCFSVMILLAPGVIMLKELPLDGSTVTCLNVLVCTPIFKYFKLKLENCLRNKFYIEYT